jgi:hypothetical protein
LRKKAASVNLVEATNTEEHRKLSSNSNTLELEMKIRGYTISVERNFRLLHKVRRAHLYRRTLMLCFLTLCETCICDTLRVNHKVMKYQLLSESICSNNTITISFHRY